MLKHVQECYLPDTKQSATNNKSIQVLLSDYAINWLKLRSDANFNPKAIALTSEIVGTQAPSTHVEAQAITHVENSKRRKKPSARRLRIPRAGRSHRQGD